MLFAYNSLYNVSIMKNIAIIAFLLTVCVNGSAASESYGEVSLETDSISTGRGRSKAPKVYDEAWAVSLKKPDESLMNVLLHYCNLPENVARVFFCLAVSDTHRFKDEDLMQANNLYCLCDENNLGRYYHYRHWSESVTDIIGIYRNELGKDINDITDLLDCITSHHNREKVKEMSRYHEMYFGRKLPLRGDGDNLLRKKNGGLPW